MSAEKRRCRQVRREAGIGRGSCLSPFWDSEANFLLTDFLLDARVWLSHPTERKFPMDAGIYITETGISSTGAEVPTEAFIVCAEPRQCVIYSRMLFPLDVSLALSEKGVTPDNFMLDFCLN